MKDYTQTLNLPKTSFSMKANLPQREPQTCAYWEEIGLYKLMQEKNAANPAFILHDGPPYANGSIHIGHALNKTLKDIIVRSKSMSGFRTPYIHGWDTHGLPIEKKMIEKNRVRRGEMDRMEFREKCREFALQNVEIQKGQMRRLGCIGDWDNSYMTIIPGFEARQIKIFWEMMKNGYIYRAVKPVYWCAQDETALAEAEIEYSDDACDSIYVKFEIYDNEINKKITNLTGGKTAYFVIWTTTAWTLPGNLGICLGGGFEYSLIRAGDACFVAASALCGRLAKAAGWDSFEVIAKFKGSELEGMAARHPLYDRDSHVICGDHVTLESGTGCVHTAPGHGLEDFMVWRKYGSELPETIVPVDAEGRMNELSGKYAGLPCADAGKNIIADLRECGALAAIEKITHQYPHCWRCGDPIIYRATEQWFCSVEGFRENVIGEIRKIKWIPSWGESRMEGMVRDRDDWCISRQRTWGVPIPVYYCSDCGEPVINDGTIERISGLFSREGSDAWYKYDAGELLGDLAVCGKCGSKSLERENDIMDVWFDSGTSYAYVLEGMSESHSFPADMYLEGHDQFRGWFQSSLLTSVASRGHSPYRSVLTHGWTIDLEGRKMSKSLGNGIDPIAVSDKYGADILRLWVASVDYSSDVNISNEILTQVAEIYRKIRNTSRMIIANLENDFNPETDMVDPGKLGREIDKWALSSLNKLIKRVGEAYSSYEFHQIYHHINNFCTINLSKLYIDITKDRLYVEKRDSHSRRSVQTVMYITLNALTRMLAPVLAFTAEEIWRSMPHAGSDDARSVMLNSMPVFSDEYNFPEIEERWERLFDLRDGVMKALEIARAEKLIGKSLDAAVTIYADGGAYKLLEGFGDNGSYGKLAEIFIVSAVTVVNGKAPEGIFSDGDCGIAVSVSPAPGQKCSRCWMYSEDGSSEEDGCLCPRCKAIVGDISDLN